MTHRPAYCAIALEGEIQPQSLRLGRKQAAEKEEDNKHHKLFVMMLSLLQKSVFPNSVIVTGFF